MDFGEVQEELGGGDGAALEGGFEGFGFVAHDDEAVAVDDVDVVGEFGGELEGHGALVVVVAMNDTGWGVLPPGTF